MIYLVYFCFIQTFMIVRNGIKSSHLLFMMGYSTGFFNQILFAISGIQKLKNS